VHLKTEKSSGPQRAGISVPREFMTIDQSQRQQEQTKHSPTRQQEVERSNAKEVETLSLLKHEARRNTQQINDQCESKSKAKECGKMRGKQMETLDEASQPRPAK